MTNTRDGAISTTTQGKVLRQLRDRIVSGALRPGEQIVQESLAADLGVSRVPLREALKVLEGEGHVTYSPHRGYFVATMTVPDLVEAYRIRELLEGEALAHAVSRLTDSDIAAITHLTDEVELASASGDIALITAANRALHFAMFECSGMPRLVRMIRTLWDATDAYRGVYMASAANIAAMNREHRAMLKALKQGDAAEVIKLQAEHRENTVSAVSQVLTD